MEIKPILISIGFKASTTGEIFNPDGEESATYVNDDGYITASIKLWDDSWQTFGVHRLMAIAHLPYEGLLDTLTVNHIDGDIGNNVIENLEWASVAENNSHAALMRGSKTRPMILAERNGEFKFVSNLDEATEIFQTDKELIWRAIKQGTEIDAWKLTHHKSGEAKPPVLRKSTFPNGRGLGRIKPRPIDILNLETLEVDRFENLHHAADFHEVKPNHIQQCISVVGVITRLFKRKYLIVDSGFPFPELTNEEYEELLNPTGKEVLAYNFVHGAFALWESASKFIKQTGLSKKAVTVDLKKGRLRQIGDWVAIYKSKPNTDKLLQYLKIRDLSRDS